MKYEKEADYIGYFAFKKINENNHPIFAPIPHFHNSTEILIIKKGEYHVYTSGEKRILGAGSINFVERFKPHTSGSVGPREELEVYLLVVSDAYLSGIQGIDERTFPPFLQNEEAFREVIELVEWNYRRNETMNEEMRIGFITSLFGILKRYFPFIPKTEEKNDELIIKIMKFISDNYREAITLQSLAAEMKYESTYLSRIFNRFFGMNLREYLNRYRISEFLKLKGKNPDTPTCKLSAEVGFVSDNTFYRAYNKYSAETNHKF